MQRVAAPGIPEPLVVVGFPPKPEPIGRNRAPGGH